MLRYLTVTASGIALAMTSPALALANPGKSKGPWFEPEVSTSYE